HFPLCFSFPLKFLVSKLCLNVMLQSLCTYTHTDTHTNPYTPTSPHTENTHHTVHKTQRVHTHTNQHTHTHTHTRLRLGLEIYGIKLILTTSAVKRLKYLIAINRIYVIVNSKLIAINRKFVSILNVPSFFHHFIFI